MEEQDKSKSIVSQIDILELLEKAVAQRRKRQESFGDEHIIRMQPPITSVEEFEELLSRWKRASLLKVVSGFVHDDPDAAEDIVQHALLRGYRNLTSGGPYAVPRKLLKHLKVIDEASQNLDLNQRDIKVDNPSAWMYTILRNTAMNYTRSKDRAEKKLKRIMELSEPEGQRFENPEATLIRTMEIDELHGHVEALPFPYSQIIRQQFFEEKKLKDIAADLGYPYSTVRVYARRALQMLKDIITEEKEMKNGKLVRKRQWAS